MPQISWVCSFLECICHTCVVGQDRRMGNAGWYKLWTAADVLELCLCPCGIPVGCLSCFIILQEIGHTS